MSDVLNATGLGVYLATLSSPTAEDEVRAEAWDKIVAGFTALEALVVAAERERDAAVRAVEQREADDQRLYESALERADAAEKALGLADRWLDLNYGYLKPEEDPLLVEFGDAVRAAVSPLPGHEPPGAQGGTASQVPRYQRGTSAVPASDGGAAVRAGGNAADLADPLRPFALQRNWRRGPGIVGMVFQEDVYSEATRAAPIIRARGALATLEPDGEETA